MQIRYFTFWSSCLFFVLYAQGNFAYAISCPPEILGAVEIRLVTETNKDGSFNVEHLCNPNSDWSPVTTEQASNDIDNNIIYYTQYEDKCALVVPDSETNPTKNVKSRPDRTTKNNLECLPDCHAFPKVRKGRNRDCED